MVKKLWVDNYKALNDFEISFTPFTLIVGNNASGKTTVMQVLNFLGDCVKESFDIILERRNQHVRNIKSKLKDSSILSFRCEVELNIKNELKILEWELQMKIYLQKNLLILVKERIREKGTGKNLLAFEAGKGGVLRGIRELEVPDLSYRMSILNHIDTENDIKLFPELAEFKKFWEKSAFFEMLSPEKMRISEKEQTNTIGRAGNKLPSFVHSMNLNHLYAYCVKINEFMEGKVSSVSARQRDDSDQVILEIKEKYGEHGFHITSEELSDGMLRLLAFAAISEMGEEYSLFMADEIENGINAAYMEKLIKILKSACEEKSSSL